jgi:hypothetical protein
MVFSQNQYIVVGRHNQPSRNQEIWLRPHIQLQPKKKSPPAQGGQNLYE